MRKMVRLRNLDLTPSRSLGEGKRNVPGQVGVKQLRLGLNPTSAPSHCLAFFESQFPHLKIRCNSPHTTLTLGMRAMPALLPTLPQAPSMVPGTE